MDDSNFRPVIFTATTNEACGVLRSKGIEAPRTIYGHSAIRPLWKPKNGETLSIHRNPSNLSHLLFIDEASYINKEAYEKIHKQWPNSKIVWVMDKAQLAPVGEEFPYVNTLGIPTLDLTTIMRNTGHLQDLNTYLRECVLTGTNPTLQGWDNGSTVKLVDGLQFQQLIDQEFNRDTWLPSQSRVLSFHRERTKTYAKYIHEDLLGNSDFYAVGTTLRQQGFCRNISDGTTLLITSKPKVRQITFPSGATTTYLDVEGLKVLCDVKEFRAIRKNNSDDALAYQEIDFANLQHTYSNTVHTAQGSTIKKVFVDLTDIQHAFGIQREMYRRLVYSAISRASEEVIIRIN